MSSRELVQRLIEGIITKLTDEINSWKENLKLKMEAELYDVVKSVVEKYGGLIDEIEKELMLEKEYKIYTIMMDYEKERLKFVEDTIGKIISKIQEKLNQMRGTEQYREYLKKCIQSAVDIIGADELIIQCSEKDKDIVDSIVKELKLNARITTVDKELYGIKASSIDGSVVTDTALETRLNLIKEDIKNLIIRLVRKV